MPEMSNVNLGRVKLISYEVKVEGKYKIAIGISAVWYLESNERAKRRCNVRKIISKTDIKEVS